MMKKCCNMPAMMWAIVVFVCYSCPAIYGQQTLSLDTCRAMALRNNRAISIAERTGEKTDYESRSYLANFFPKISVTGAYLYTNTSFNKTIPGNYLPTYVPNPATGGLTPNLLTMPDGRPVMGADGNPVFKEYAMFPEMAFTLGLSGSYLAGIHAEQPLFMGGKILSAYKMSTIGKEIAGLNKNLTRTEVIVRTDEAYWMHLQAIESKKAALSFRDVITELLQTVRNAQEAGMKTKNDLLKVQVQLNRAELQLQQAENAIRLSRMNLCHITGLGLTSEISIADGLDTPLLELLPGADITGRPEYAILDRQIELKSQEIRLVRSDFLPNVGIAANYGYMRGLELNGVPFIDKASFSALLTVKIPIFHWGEGVNKVRAAKAGKQIMQLQRADLNEKMELEMTQALDRCHESKLEVDLTVRALEQAAENMRTSRNRYEAGMETLTDCMEAQTLWQQAWLEMIRAKTGQRLNETRYLKATGEL